MDDTATTDVPLASALKQVISAVQEEHADVAAQASQLPREAKVEHAARQAASAPAARGAIATPVATASELLKVDTTAAGSAGATKAHVVENETAAAATLVQTAATKTNPMTVLPRAACDWMIQEASQHATPAKTVEKVAGVAPDTPEAAPAPRKAAVGSKTAEHTARGEQEAKGGAAAPAFIKACAERAAEAASRSGSESDTVASDVPSSSLQNSVFADAAGDTDDEDTLVAQTPVLTQLTPTYTPKPGFETTPFDPYSHVCYGWGRKEDTPPSFDLPWCVAPAPLLIFLDDPAFLSKGYEQLLL